MKIFKGALATGAFFMWALVFSVAVLPQAQAATIKGKVINKTGGETPVPDGEVRLRKFVDEAPREDVSGRTDENGEFEFAGLSTGETETHYVLFKYANVDYFTGPVKLENDDDEETADVDVYEVTESNADVKLTLHHIVVDFEDSSTLKVREILLFENSGDRTYVGDTEFSPGKKETATFTLPAGATAFQEEQGIFSAFFETTADGIKDSMPVVPGDRQVAYGYSVKVSGDDFAFERPLDFDTPDFSLLVQDTGVKVAAPTLTSQGSSQGEGGQNFLHFVGKDLKRGEKIEANLSGLGSGRTVFYWVLIGLLAVPVAATIGVPLLRRRRRDRELADPERTEAAQIRALDKERRDLVAAIAALDDRHEAGQLKTDEYKKVRSERKRKLVEVTEELKAKRR